MVAFDALGIVVPFWLLDGASVRPRPHARIGAGTQSAPADYAIPCECAQAVAIARAVRPEAPIFAYTLAT